MEKPYLPSSSFLLAVKDDLVDFSDGLAGRKNLKELITLTQDSDQSNRDWATFLLSELEVDTDEVRAALLKGVKDPDIAVRSEAIRGLAIRDRALALPFVREALSSRVVYAPVLEAAEIVADPTLVDDLRCFADASDNPYLDALARDALNACSVK